MARCPAGHESQAGDYCDTCGLVIGGEAPAPAAPLAQSSAAVSGPGLAAPGAGSGSPCPVCQAERNGRFCEECGYDFELAEAMPQAVLTPGVTPAEQGAQTTVTAVAPVSPVSEGEQGLDLAAELARAEAEAARGTEQGAATIVTPSSETGSAAEAAAAAEGAGEPEPEQSAPVESPFPAMPSNPLLTRDLSLLVNADLDYYKAQVERGDIIESEFPFPKYPSERRFAFTSGPVRIGRASSSRGLMPEIDLTGPPLDPAVSHLHAQLLLHDEGWVVVDLGSANGTRLNEAEEPLEAETEIPVKPGDRIHLGVWTTITVQ